MKIQTEYRSAFAFLVTLAIGLIWVGITFIIFIFVKSLFNLYLDYFGGMSLMLVIMAFTSLPVMFFTHREPKKEDSHN